ncbi:hypothetical protein [Haloprofundus salilacus]|uniref:hypothetical protein n=1 Tax=Haloprofundus salilacus TaxID=2876190 RepID=UPI001CCF20FF|nr:hypothetical protein [Haloprofundus salilacus]
MHHPSNSDETWFEIEFTVQNDNPFAVEVEVEGSIRVLVSGGDGEEDPQYETLVESRTKKLSDLETWEDVIRWDKTDGPIARWGFDIVDVTKLR